MWSASREMLHSYTREHVEVSNVLFADDIMLLCRSVESAQTVLVELEEALKSAGLTINVGNTKWMIIPPRYDEAGVQCRRDAVGEGGQIIMQGECLSQVEEVVCLGSLVTSQASSEQSLGHRMQCAEACWHTWKPVLTCRKAPFILGLNALVCGPMLSLLWLSETWTIHDVILSKAKAWIHRKAGLIVGLRPDRNDQGGLDMNKFWRERHTSGK